MTSVSSVTEEINGSTGALTDAINTITSLAENVLESTESVSHNAKIQEDMMEDMRQRINDLSVLSHTLKKDMNVFKSAA